MLRDTRILHSINQAIDREERPRNSETSGKASYMLKKRDCDVATGALMVVAILPSRHHFILSMTYPKKEVGCSTNIRTFIASTHSNQWPALTPSCTTTLILGHASTAVSTANDSDSTSGNSRS
jgi:hypothetical protein